MSTRFRHRWVGHWQQAAAAVGVVLMGSALGTLVAAQSFDRPAPAPFREVDPSRMDGAVPGRWHGGVQVAPYEGLRTDGYPSNRNLNLDDRSPRLGPTLPDRRGDTSPSLRPGGAAADWGSMPQQQPDARRGDGAPPRRF
jgi:hypothetical protein